MMAHHRRAGANAAGLEHDRGKVETGFPLGTNAKRLPGDHAK
jgi:hypothetical protein